MASAVELESHPEIPSTRRWNRSTRYYLSYCLNCSQLQMMQSPTGLRVDDYPGHQHQQVALLAVAEAQVFELQVVFDGTKATAQADFERKTGDHR